MLLRLEIERLEQALERAMTYARLPDQDPEVKRLREEIAKLERELKERQ